MNINKREYHGIPDDFAHAGRVQICWLDPKGGQYHDEPLPLYLDKLNKSPTGFAWGYGGSGPAQLAFAILMHHTGDQAIAEANFQDYKFEVIARLEHGPWVITSDAVTQWLEEKHDERTTGS